ncbi:MAG: transposase [Bacteroidia bacterium]|nr:transposase [Bacteroidia bacterium]
MASIYYHGLNSGHGVPTKDARLVIGAVIIKHKMKLSDREVIAQIQENPYLQSFVGLEKFTTQPVSDPSLFSTIRKRLGVAEFEALNEALLAKAGMVEASKNEESDSQDPIDPPSHNPATELLAEPRPEEPSAAHPGKLLIDAVVTEQMIKYPNDLELLNDSRVQARRWAVPKRIPKWKTWFWKN